MSITIIQYTLRVQDAARQASPAYLSVQGSKAGLQSLQPSKLRLQSLQPGFNIHQNHIWIRIYNRAAHFKAPLVGANQGDARCQLHSSPAMREQQSGQPSAARKHLKLPSAAKKLSELEQHKWSLWGNVPANWCISLHIKYTYAEAKCADLTARLP